MQAAQAAALSQPIVPGLIPVVSNNLFLDVPSSRDPVLSGAWTGVLILSFALSVRKLQKICQKIKKNSRKLASLDSRGLIFQIICEQPMKILMRCCPSVSAQFAKIKAVFRDRSKIIFRNINLCSQTITCVPRQ